MRTYASVIVGAALFAFPAAALAQDVEIGPGGVGIGPGYHHHYYQGRSVGRRNCYEMRQACLNKRELGEEGRGNCQHYRHFCGD